LNLQFDIFKTSLEKVETVEPEEANKPGTPMKVTTEMKEQFMKEFEVGCNQYVSVASQLHVVCSDSDLVSLLN
jgi:hypothetical protein